MRRNARKGSGMLEVALVLPVLMIVLLGIADLGRYVYATNLMPYLAREGSRWASLELARNSGKLDSAKVDRYVRSLAVGLPTESVQVATQVEPRRVAVRVGLVFRPVLNFFGKPMTIEGQSAMVVAPVLAGAAQLPE